MTFPVLYLLFRIFLFYGTLVGIVWCFVAGWRRLRSDRRNPNGWVLIILAALPPLVTAGVWGYAELRPYLRQAEIASWPRAAVPSPHPRTLSIRVWSWKPERLTYALRLAESGLFDVHIEAGADNALTGRKKSYWKVELDIWPDCFDRRVHDNDFVVAAAFEVCGRFVPDQTPPSQGLILYSGTSSPTVPLALKHPRPRNLFVRWALQIGLRDHGGETLLAYEEGVSFPRLGLNPFGGPSFQRRRDGRKAVASGVTVSDVPDPSTFVFRALGIDPLEVLRQALRPPERLASLLEAALDDDPKQGVRRVLDAIAGYPDSDPAFAALVRRLAEDPETSSRLGRRITCPYLDGMSRYRMSLVEGCATNPDEEQKYCGKLGTARDWFAVCGDMATPIWQTRRSHGLRVLVAAGWAKRETNLALRNGAWGRAATLVVPPDLGLIDLVLASRSGVIWHFEGALECLGRVTVVDGHDAVLGVPEARVRFRYTDGAAVGQSRSRTSLSPELEAFLGPRPDVAVIRSQVEILSLGEAIEAQGRRGEQACRSKAPGGLASSGAFDLDALDPAVLVTVPTWVPRQRPMP